MKVIPPNKGNIQTIFSDADASLSAPLLGNAKFITASVAHSNEANFAGTSIYPGGFTISDKASFTVIGNETSSATASATNKLGGDTTLGYSIDLAAAGGAMGLSAQQSVQPQQDNHDPILNNHASAGIVFIDTRVEHYEAILAGLNIGIEVCLIDPSSDGIDQIANFLQGRANISSLQIVSHGSTGTLFLGSTALSSLNLSEYMQKLAAIGSALAETGEILLYGCSIGEGYTGKTFIEAIAQASGADVAASTDATGSSNLGGNWILEAQVGSIESPLISAPGYDGLLLSESEPNDSRATATAVPLNTVINGQLSSGADVDYFSASIAAAGVMSINFTKSVNADRYKFSVYDSAGTLLVGSWDTRHSTSFSLGVETAGTYYVSVSSALPNFFNTEPYSLSIMASAGGSGSYESESNDTRATADAVLLGATINGQLSSPADVDFFSISIGSQGVMSLTFTKPQTNTDNIASNTYYSLSAYDSAGNTLGSWWAGNQFCFGAGAAGTYYVSVTGANNTWQYSMALAAAIDTTGTYESEPNGSRATADVVSLNSTINGNLSSGTDIDFYSTSIGASGILNITFTEPVMNTKPFIISVYDSAGMLLGSWRHFYTHGILEGFSCGASAAGTYYVSVSAADAYNYDINLGGQYSVMISASAGGADSYESESNDTRATADAVTLNTTISGQLSSLADIDYFSINVATSGVMSFAFAPSFTSAADNFNLSVYDSAGTLLGSRLTGSVATVSCGISTAGTYYVSIVSPGLYSIANNGQYSLTISASSGGASSYESESNDSRATADAVPLGAAINGQLSSLADVDYFSVSTGTSGVLNITFTEPEFNLNPFTISAYDSAGTMLGSWVTNDSGAFSVGMGTAGTYYVSITGASNTRQYSLAMTASLAGAGSYESESNDSRATADVVLPGAAINGQLSSSTDIDYFSVNAETSGVLNITFTKPTLNPYPYTFPSSPYTISAYDSAGTMLGSWVTNDSGAFSVGMGTAGTYYVSITGASNTGQYSLAMSASAGGASSYESESNDSRVTADAVLLDAEVNGQLSSNTDIDYFCVNTGVSSNMYIGFTAPASNSFVYTISAYDSAGTLLKSWYTNTSGVFSLDTNVAGTYYVSVTGAYNTNPYSLTISNDFAASVDTLGSVAVNGSVSSDICDSFDSDYFKIQLTAGTAYQFDLLGSETNSGTLSDPYLKLRNASGVVLRSDDDGASKYLAPSANSQIVFIAPETGTYFLDVSGFSGSTGTYQLVAATLPSNYYIESLLFQPNERWNTGSALGSPVNVTFSFPTYLPPEYAGYVDGFASFSETQKMAARQVLQQISTYTNITFSESSDQNGQLRFATSYQSLSAGETMPFTPYGHSDIALASNYSPNTSPTIGTEGWDILIHEIGHAIGLKHPGDYVGGGGSSPPYLPTSQDTKVFTIETYNDLTTFAKSPMIFDVAALQYLYGANNETGVGNDIYSFNTAAIYTIWDAGGRDTIDASVWNSSVTINLNPGTASYVGLIGTVTTLSPCVGVAFSCWIENAIGSNSADAIFGNSRNNSLMGQAGNDSIIGGDGNDILNGGAGNDTMIGGLGNDTYVVNALTDIVTELAGQGTDLIQSSISYSLMNTDGAGANGGNVENLQLIGTGNINATGNTLSNVLTGNAGANTLSGGAGNDTMIGGAGNDILNGGTGIDTASYQTATSGVTVSLATTATQATGGAGSDTLIAIESLTGSNYSDTLTGNTGANTLDGGTGNDTMVGGDGSDTYHVRDAGDIVTETNAVASTGGTDLVNSYLGAYTLAPNVESGRIMLATATNLTGNALNNTLYAGAGNNVLDGGAGVDTASYLYATAAVTVNLATTTAQATGGSGSDTLLNIESLTGSNYNDTLTGNAGNNLLNGGLGNDTMIGGLGNDTYVVNSLSDVVTEAAASGTDTVQTGITYTLGPNIENLLLTGTGSINATGNALNNILYANSGNNVLDGGTGVDTASYQYATAAVTVSLGTTAVQATGGSGSDTLLNIENLTGSNFNDTLTGNAGANTINGGAGNDILNGGLGNDVLTGGGGIDSFVFNTAPNTTTNRDTINDFVSGTDKIYLDDAIFTTIGAVGGFASGDVRFCSAAGATAGQDADDRVVYNTTTGALYYDADGSSAGAAVQVALLGTATHPGLAAGDFVVV